MLGDPRLEYIAAGQRFQIGVGDDILRGHPVAHLSVLANVVLEPAIGIGDFDVEMRLDQVLARRRRIVEFGLAAVAAWVACMAGAWVPARVRRGRSSR